MSADSGSENLYVHQKFQYLKFLPYYCIASYGDTLLLVVSFHYLISASLVVAWEMEQYAMR